MPSKSPSRRDPVAIDPSRTAAASERPPRLSFRNSIYEQSRWVSLFWLLLAVLIVAGGIALTAP